MDEKQGQQDHRNSAFSLLQPSQMASLSNSKEHPNQFTNSGDMAEITKRSVSDGGSR